MHKFCHKRGVEWCFWQKLLFYGLMTRYDRLWGKTSAPQLICLLSRNKGCACLREVMTYLCLSKHLCLWTWPLPINVRWCPINVCQCPAWGGNFYIFWKVKKSQIPHHPRQHIWSKVSKSPTLRQAKVSCTPEIASNFPTLGRLYRIKIPIQGQASQSNSCG